MELVAAVIAAVLLLAFGLERWLVVQARGQQRRTSARLDALSLRVAGPTALAVSRPADEPVQAGAGPSPASDRAPAFALELLGGGRATLDALLAPGKPLMLVFTHPRCGPCYELLPDIGGWQRVYGTRVTVALITSGDPETNVAMTAEYGIRPVLLQQAEEVADAYDVAQLPAAILIGPDGRIASELRYGGRAIRQLMAETLGLALPEAPAIDASPLRKGEPLPAIRRPDLYGNVINLGAPRREPMLLLFWSPGCTHCRDLLPDILALEEAIGPQRMLIVSRGPIALNREIGFRSTVLLDDDSSIGRTFGVTGTPAAVLLDHRAVVATPVARGVAGVRSAMTAVGSLFGLAPATAAG